jgi:hypothetical protein
MYASRNPKSSFELSLLLNSVSQGHFLSDRPAARDLAPTDLLRLYKNGLFSVRHHSIHCFLTKTKKATATVKNKKDNNERHKGQCRQAQKWRQRLSNNKGHNHRHLSQTKHNPPKIAVLWSVATTKQTTANESTVISDASGRTFALLETSA